MNKKRPNGFTLIELLVVISIIGVLTMLITMNFVGVRERGRDTKRKSDLKSVKTALAMYYNNCGYYPDSNTDHQLVGCGASETCSTAVACTWGSGWNLNGVDYMKLLPKDPLSTDTVPVYYTYTRIDNNNFKLSTFLDNKSDEIGLESRTQCSFTQTAGKNDYVVCSD